jgi:hypothetical protein
VGNGVLLGSYGGRQITFGELPMFDVVEDVDGKILSTSGDGELWTMNYDGSCSSCSCAAS